jgi:RNA polymerase sigma-70 factor (sigma-E family)
MTIGEHGAGGSREDELLSRLYQRITERQAARFAPGYDIEAGLGRYRAWLGQRTAERQDQPEVIQLRRPMTWQASPRVAGAAAAAAYSSGPAVVPARPIHVTEVLVAGAALGLEPAEWDAEQAVTAMYSTHYRSLVRLAALLVRDVATAEEVVQDSFIAMHGAWRRLRDNDKALSYLRQSVVNRSRSVIRHRVTVDKNAPKPAPDMPSAEQGALTLMERSAVVAALRSLPPRQREALVLRYYGDLSEAQIASAMGISRGAVKSHTARAIASLRAVLEMEK